MGLHRLFMGNRRAADRSKRGGSRVVLGIALERTARMRLLAATAGTIQPIDPQRTQEVHDWVTAS